MRVKLCSGYLKWIRRPLYWTRNTFWNISMGKILPNIVSCQVSNLHYSFCTARCIFFNLRSLKNCLAVLITSFCYLVIVYTYHWHFILLKRTIFWDFCLIRKNNAVTNDKSFYNLRVYLLNLLYDVWTWPSLLDISLIKLEIQFFQIITRFIKTIWLKVIHVTM